MFEISAAVRACHRQYIAKCVCNMPEVFPIVDCSLWISQRISPAQVDIEVDVLRFDCRGSMDRVTGKS